MTETNWTFPGTAANVDQTPGDPWSNYNNAKADDGNYTSSSIQKEGPTDILRLTNFGFSLASGTTINGIEVRIERYGDNSDITDYSVYLRKSTGTVGDDYASGSSWPGTATAVDYGGASDLWNASWSASEVNDSSFGVEIRAYNNSTTDLRFAYIDYVQIKIHYTIQLSVDDASHSHTVEVCEITPFLWVSASSSFDTRASLPDLVEQAFVEAVADDCLHSHTSESLTLTQTHFLTANDALHAHTAESVSLTEIKSLVVGSCLHNHTAENIDLTQLHYLVVANTSHTHTAENVTLVQTHSLTVQNCSHAHTVESLILTQQHILIVDSTFHSHTAGSVSLFQLHYLVVSDTYHNHTAESITLSQAHLLIVQNCSHAHTVDSVTLAQQHILTVSPALHSHTAESISLSQEHNLTVSNTLHSHTADNVGISTATFLVVGNALHQHTAENVNLTQTHTLTVAHAAHAHTAESVALLQTHILTVEDTFHSHTATSPSLTQLHYLVVANTSHSHTAENVDLTSIVVLVVANSIHAHTATSPTLVFISGGLTDYAELKVLNHILKVEVYSPPGTVYLALSSADPTDDASGFSEPVGGGYSRQVIAFGSASARSIAQSATISFGQATASWGTVTHWTIMNASTGGTALAHGRLDSASYVAVGEVPRLGIGEAQISVIAGGFFTQYVNSVLDWLFRNQTLNVPDNIYIAASTTVPDDTGNVTEPSGGSYARAQHNSWATAAGGASYNVGTIEFAASTASWGTVVGLAGYTASSGGTAIFYGLVVDTNVPADSNVRLPEGNYDIYVD